MPARPDWTREELILALDLYFREPAARGSKSHPQVQELSEVLRSLPDNAEHAKDPDFRNPNGVGMKLSNFLRFDPDYTGTGLARGAKLEEEIWNEFAGDRGMLRAVAQAIRENLSADPATLGTPPAPWMMEKKKERQEGPGLATY